MCAVSRAYARHMKLVAVLALVCGFLAAPAVAAGDPSVSPACDGVDCVPYVKHNVVQGGSCVLASRYVFGLDVSGKTYICTGQQAWAAQSEPLIGVRSQRQFCTGEKGWAQSPDGIPLRCVSQGWSQDYSAIYFPVYQPPPNPAAG